MTHDLKCPRCGAALKVVEVKVPIKVTHAEDMPVSVVRYEIREEVSDCPRCTGSY